MKTDKKTIFIDAGDRDGGRKSLDEKAFMRSVENQLESWDRDFDPALDGKSCTVVAKDKIDAMLLGKRLRLESVTYHDGETVEKINFAVPIKRARPSDMLIHTKISNGKTKDRFIKQSNAQIKAQYLSEAKIVKLKLLTRSELEGAINAGILKPVISMRGSYINRVEVVEYAKSKNQTLPF